MQTKLVGMQQKASQLQQMAQQQPENEQQQAEIRKIQSVLPNIMAQIEFVTNNLESEKTIIDKIAHEAKRINRFDYKHFKEEIAENILIYLKDVMKIENEIHTAFTNNNVTGRHYYFVDQLEDNKHPVFESLDPLKVFYPKIGGIKRINKLPWVVISDKKSFDNVMTELGDKIMKRKDGKEILDKLEDKYSDANDSNFVATPEGAMPNTTNGAYSGTYHDGSGITIDRVYFKSQRTVKVKFSPNPHKPGKYFKNFINPQHEIIKEDNYNYDSENKEYVNVENDDDRIRTADATTYSLAKGQFIKTYYTNDIYEAIVIDHEYVVGARKKRFIPRYGNHHGDINLPVFGRTHTSLADRPYSLIFATKDLQDLYDVVHTQRELMIALAGTKSIFFDRSQKPTDISDDDWAYERKMGTIQIQSQDENGSPIRTNFNQWSMVDLSLSPSIQYLYNILIQIEETMGNIVGIPRQRQAQVQDTDQVGTFKESIKRSFVITEVLFNKHEEIAAEALTHMVNLAGRYAYRNGGKIETNDRINGRRILQISKDILKRVDLRVDVTSSGQSQQRMNELKDLAAVHYKNGQLPFLALLNIFDARTVNEMRTKVEYFTNRAEELNAKAVQADKDSERQLALETQQYTQEFESFWKDKEMQAEQFKTQFDMKNEEFKSMLDKEKLDLDKLRLKIESELKMYELQNEKQSEDNAVVSNNKNTEVNARLKELEIYLNYMVNSAQMNLGEKQLVADVKKNKDTHTENMKKVSSDNVGKKTVKEHVSDN